MDWLDLLKCFGEDQAHPSLCALGTYDEPVLQHFLSLRDRVDGWSQKAKILIRSSGKTAGAQRAEQWRSSFAEMEACFLVERDLGWEIQAFERKADGIDQSCDLQVLAGDRCSLVEVKCRCLQELQQQAKVISELLQGAAKPFWLRTKLTGEGRRTRWAPSGSEFATIRERIKSHVEEHLAMLRRAGGQLASSCPQSILDVPQAEFSFLPPGSSGGAFIKEVTTEDFETWLFGSGSSMVRAAAEKRADHLFVGVPAWDWFAAEKVLPLFKNSELTSDRCIESADPRLGELKSVLVFSSVRSWFRVLNSGSIRV